MIIYEKRCYNIMVGHMPEAIRLYQEIGWPALTAGGFDAKLVGYFISDTGPLHQIVHLWRFDDDADRRDFWARLFSDPAFMEFAPKFRPHIQNQEVQLLTSAPWGPTP